METLSLNVEAPNFDVEAQLFIERTPADSSKKREFLVPTKLLPLLSVGQESPIIVFERQNPKLGKRDQGLTVEARTIRLSDIIVDDYRNSDDIHKEIISAHAVATFHHSERSFISQDISQDIELLDYKAGDKFFFLETPKTVDTRFAKVASTVEVLSLRTRVSGLMPAKCLVFCPHIKVKKSFEWNTMDGGKVKNEVGHLITTGQRSWIMTWSPEGPRKTKDLCTFGQNLTTKYSGLVPMDKIVELSSKELDDWKEENPIPIRIVEPTSDSVDQPVVCDHEDCDCFLDEMIDEVEVMRNMQGFGYSS